MSGKGSRPRPYSVDQKTFDSNWDAIFGKKEKESKDSSEVTNDKNKENDNGSKSNDN